MNKCIAIVCGAPSSEHLAPFDDPSWEIWVLGNRLNKHAGRRISRIFEIHDDLSEHGDQTAYAQWLVSKNIPMVVGAGFPLSVIPDHVQPFPFAAAAELFGYEYLTSSAAYMMALAILEGAKEIAVYGSDMAIDDIEYFWQRPCLEAWIGFARGRGIKVTIPEVSALGKSTRVEGRASGGKYKASGPFTVEQFGMLAEMHRLKIEDKLAQIRTLENQVQVHGGAQQAYERLAKVARAVEAGQVIASLTETVNLK